MSYTVETSVAHLHSYQTHSVLQSFRDSRSLYRYRIDARQCYGFKGHKTERRETRRVLILIILMKGPVSLETSLNKYYLLFSSWFNCGLYPKNLTTNFNLLPNKGGSKKNQRHTSTENEKSGHFVVEKTVGSFLYWYY